MIMEQKEFPLYEEGLDFVLHNFLHNYPPMEMIIPDLKKCKTCLYLDKDYKTKSSTCIKSGKPQNPESYQCELYRKNYK